MTMWAYYNEFDPKAAAWLRELIKAGLIADGEVDTRSIVDVRGDDLRGFTQCHFFAGIGGWSYALRIAGWPDERPVWTGSCPCQPFSAAGKRKGTDDARHLWPELFRLIQERRPVQVMGEQVASKDGLAWLDTVLSDLEGANYAAGAVDLCAAGVGSPHIRQRLWWMADADGWDASAEREQRGREQRQQPQDCGASTCSQVYKLVNADDARRQRHGSQQIHGERYREGQELRPAGSSAVGGVTLGDTERAGLEGHAGHGHNWSGWAEQARPIAPAGVVGGFWSGAELIWCRDRKFRPVEPGTFPLAHGLPARVGRLRGYGNAIVPQVAAAFIETVM